MSRIIYAISKRICKLREKFIKFPSDDELRQVKQNFFAIANFPGVIGTIDGSHVPIIKPSSSDYEEFRCRKGFFSINVQDVSSPNLKFINIVARWKGSTHDSRIWRNSSLCYRCQNGVSGVLLGDSGYPCTNVLLTPIQNPSSDAQQRYNSAHIKTRNTVERMFGVWKSRFFCLQKGLRFKPSLCCHIIIATAILHNIAIDQNEYNQMDEFYDDSSISDVPQPEHIETNSLRNRLVEEHFSN